MLKIGIFNQKGGVGKTITALNLAGAFVAKQQTVTLLDLDPQAHLTSVFQSSALDPNKHLFQFYQAEMPLAQLRQPVGQGMQLISANAALIKVDSSFGRGPTILKKLSQGLNALANDAPTDALVMDCCAYIGVISLNAIVACDVLIVPVATDYFSIEAARKVDRALNALEPVLKRRIARRYLLTRVSKRKKMALAMEDALRSQFGEAVCITKISENIALAESSRHGKTVFAYDKTSAGARDYAALVQELLAQSPVSN